MPNVFDENITPLLSIANNEDLQPLVDYIVKSKLSENITSNKDYKKYYPDHSKYISIIEEEIKRFGGNSLINLLRRGGPDYYTIVCDVADKLGAKYKKQAPISEIEMSIIIGVLSIAWQKMSKEQKKEFTVKLGASSLKDIPPSLPADSVLAAVETSGLAAFMVTMTVASAVSATLLGQGLTLAAGTSVARAASIFAGSVGLVITGIWTLLDLAGPAYRVTIPCVIHIALLRQKYLIEHCVNCSAPITSSDNFCPNCGTKIER